MKKKKQMMRDLYGLVCPTLGFYELFKKFRRNAPERSLRTIGS